MLFRKLAAELLGTAVLVFFTVGTFTLAFGLEQHGGSLAAGVVTIALASGLVLAALYYAIGPISGCHVNPAVTVGVVIAGRMSLADGLRYVIAQAIGGVLGAFTLRSVLLEADAYSPVANGLGANGWDVASMIGLHTGGAFLAEAVLTFLFVWVFLLVTRHAATGSIAGLAVAAGLAAVHLVGTPMTGASVNPARSLGPALLAGGDALAQLWLFIFAPMLGAGLAAACARLLVASRPAATEEPVESEEDDREELAA